MTDSEAYDNAEDVARDREDERIREARWAEFVKEMKYYIGVLGLRDLLLYSDLAQSERPMRWEPAVLEAELLGFAETEGWDGVLAAIARAYREEQKKESK